MSPIGLPSYFVDVLVAGVSDPSYWVLQGVDVGFSRVSISYTGLGDFMRTSAALRVALSAHAEVGVRFAKTIAPVGPPRDPHRSEFRDSIHSVADKGLDGRAAVRIVASPIWPEVGRKHHRPYRGSHTLRRTVQYLNAPKRSA